MADPIQQYPSLFSKDSLMYKSPFYAWLKAYPYAAPNLLSALLLFLEAAICWFGLHETLQSRRNRRDRGIEFWRKVRLIFARCVRGRSAGYSLVGEKPWDPLEDGEELAVRDPQRSTKISRPTPIIKSRLPFSRMWTKNVVFVLLTIAIFDFQMG